jgi:hexosaminidase
MLNQITRSCCFSLLLPSLLLLSLLLLSFPQRGTAQPREFPSPLPVIPVPALQQQSDGVCVLATSVPVFADSLHHRAATDVAALLAAHGDDISGVRPLPAAKETRPDIRFISDPAVAAAEGYILDITERGVRIRARTEAGGFYAAQTLRQLLPASMLRGARPRALRLPVVHVEDAPRFAWRGVMLDCSRHFIPADDLRRMIDRFAALKFNRLHLHLTDDQGWRLEIRGYPALTSIGAWRGRGTDRTGGFYTQDEMRDIIAYAAARHMIIVPEIDLPGHTTAALASYPALDCFSRPREVATEVGQHAAVLCAGREWTYEFVADVMKEVAALFPSPWIHIGGDEVQTQTWQKCYSCQVRRVRQGYADTDALRGYFTTRVADIVRGLGKVPIGWNETYGDAPPYMVIQAWHGMYIANRAAESGHPVICSPNAESYFDYDHEKNSLGNTYAFDPCAETRWDAALPPPLGVECCLWTQDTRSPAEMHRQLFPRAAAFAEVAWSPVSQKDWPLFQRRLGALGGHWAMAGTPFTLLNDISWDDGAPLTVAYAALSRNGQLHITCSVGIAQTGMMEDAPPRDVITCADPVHVSLADSRTLSLTHNAMHEACFRNAPLLGLRKAGNPWSPLVDTTSADGLFRITDAIVMPEALGFSVAPNPLLSRQLSPVLQLRFSLPVPGNALLRVFDSAGKEVLRLSVPTDDFGPQQLQLRLPPLAAGLYVMLLQSGSLTGSTTLLVL